MIRQRKSLQHSPKLWKLVAIQREMFSKQTSSFLKVAVLKNLSHWKSSYSKSRCSRFTFIQYSVSVVNLSKNDYRKKNFYTITVRGWCQTHLTIAFYKKLSPKKWANYSELQWLLLFYRMVKYQKKFFETFDGKSWAPNREKLHLLQSDCSGANFPFKRAAHWFFFVREINCNEE